MSAEPTSSKVCNICQLVQNGDDKQRDESISSKRLHRVLCCVNHILPVYLNVGHLGIYLDLIDNVEGIRISCVREDYLHQGVRNAISAAGRSFKGILEVDRRIIDRSMTTEDDKACNADALILG